MKFPFRLVNHDRVNVFSEFNEALLYPDDVIKDSGRGYGQAFTSLAAYKAENGNIITLFIDSVYPQNTEYPIYGVLNDSADQLIAVCLDMVQAIKAFNSVIEQDNPKTIFGGNPK